MSESYLWQNDKVAVQALPAGRAEVVILAPTTVGEVQATLTQIISQLQWQVSLFQNALQHYLSTPVLPNGDEDLQPQPTNVEG